MVFFKSNEIPTALKVTNKVNEDPELPNVSRRTINRLLHDLGFEFRKRNRQSILIEREDIQVWRRKYLRDIKNYRSKGKAIYYLDETWINFGHTKSKVWQDKTVKTPKQAFLEGLSTGLKAPSGKGSRLINTHAGSEKGFVSEAKEVFKAKKDSGDYHSEMNGPHFEEWFEKKLLPNLDNSVIVMDNAPYHSVLKEEIPNTSTKKANIQSWLTSKQISWTPDMIKAELLELVALVRDKYTKYQIDELRQVLDIQFCACPHTIELNPIELVWSQVKGYVANKNKTFKEEEVKRLTNEAIENVSADQWKRYIKHVINEEQQMWELDGLVDSQVDKL
ncbi:hypothetical protein JTE90_029237 [Oedothorax gibbosus]|uniref:Tc1-like transposase DDE domain-containing protein n=1 Tax=Oedothorax gibbosus TaxID=931172 RepID=A0AAV6TUG9_9ARAC|nr:hypothetical protein JTE90_029237 [Oedothorax gibbosus]